MMGQTEAKDNFQYPDVEKIKNEWNRIHNPIRDGLEELSIEELNNKPPAPFDRVANSAGELWAFINHHQTYHIWSDWDIEKRIWGKPMSYDYKQD